MTIQKPDGAITAKLWPWFEKPKPEHSLTTISGGKSETTEPIKLNWLRPCHHRGRSGN